MMSLPTVEIDGCGTCDIVLISEGVVHQLCQLLGPETVNSTDRMEPLWN